MAIAGSVTVKALLDASGIERSKKKIEADLKDIGDGAFDSLDEGAEDASESVRKVGDEGEKTSEKLKATEESASKAGEALRVGLAGAAVAAGAAAFSVAADYEGATSRIQAALGVTREEAERFRDIGAGIYEAGWGDSLDQVTDALIQTKETIRDIDETGLENVTKNAMALEKVFGADVNETIRGTNALMEGFGLTAEEASDLMAAGMQRGLNYTDELGDNLAEYAGRWGDAGMEASQYFSLLEAGTANGAYNLDKVGDFLNEFLTSLSDGRMEENIGRLSDGTQQVFENFKAGKATAEDVLNAVIGDMQSMADETERASIASDLWSSLGEDNAMKMILAMGNVEDTFGNVAGASEQVASTMEQSFAQKAQSAARTLMGSLEGLGDPLLNIAGWVADLVTQFADWFGGMDDGTQRMIVGLAAAAAAAGPAARTIGSVKSAAQGAKGIVELAGKAFDVFADAAGLAGSKAEDAGRKSEKAAGKIKLANVAMTAAKGAAVGLAVAGLALIINKLKEMAEEEAEFEKATDGLKDAVRGTSDAAKDAAGGFEAFGGGASSAKESVDELRKSQAEWVDTLNERQGELNGTVATIEAYGKTIEDLAGRSDLTAAEQAQLMAAVDGLNDSCGTSLEVAQDAGGAYQVMGDGAALAKDDIYQLIEAQKAQAAVEVYQQDYTEAMQQQADAADTLAAAQQDYNDKMAQAQKMLDDGLISFQTYESLQRQYNDDLADAQELYDSASYAVDGYEEKLTLAQIAMENLDGGYAALIVNNQLFQSTLTSNGYSLDTFRSQMEQTGIAVEDFQSLNEDQLTQLAQNYDGTMMSIVDQMEEFGFDAGFLGTDAGRQFAEGLNSQSWAALQAASDVCGVSAQELAKLASEAGVSGNEAVQLYANGIRAGKDPSSWAAEVVRSAAAGELSSLASSAWGWGNEAGENFAAGIRATQISVSSAASAIAGAVAAWIGHSVPKKGDLRGSGRGEVEFGEHAAQNFARGIVNATPEVAQAAEFAANQAAEPFMQPPGLANETESWAFAGGYPATANYRGASSVSSTSKTANVTINLYATVREEADIKKISHQMAKEFQRKAW